MDGLPMLNAVLDFCSVPVTDRHLCLRNAARD